MGIMSVGLAKAIVDIGLTVVCRGGHSRVQFVDKQLRVRG